MINSRKKLLQLHRQVILLLLFTAMRIKLPELKSSALVIKTPPGDREPIISKFSSYSTLINVCSWIGRFAANVTKEKEKRTLLPNLTVNETLEAERTLFRIHQTTFFAKDVILLRAGSKIPPSSSLYPLHPFMDEKGVVRVGGCLRHSYLTLRSTL